MFERPEFLIFMLLVPIVIFSHAVSLHRSKKRAILFSNFEAMRRVNEKLGHPKNVVWLIFRITIIILFSFAMAGTSYTYETEINNADYVLALDASSSMLSEDVLPTRFDAAKDAEMFFLDILNEDGAKSRVAPITFAGSTFVHSAPTYKLGEVRNIVENLNISDVPGTSIGESIVTATNLLYESKNAKIMYLITDGQSNVGVDVDFAIEYAQANFLQVNTIGIGVVKDPLIPEERLGSSLDDETLKRIANETGGEYHQVKSAAGLSAVFKKEQQTTIGKYAIDLTRYLLLAILTLFFIEWVIMGTTLKTIP